MMKLPVIVGALFGALWIDSTLASSCVYNLDETMLPNSYDANSAVRFPDMSEFVDSTAATGGTTEYTLDTAISVLGGSDVKKMKIYDTGFVEFVADGGSFSSILDYSNSGIIIGANRLDRVYAAAKWYVPPGTLDSNKFEFTSYRILASALVSTGTDIGPSQCILNMAAARIDRCNDVDRGTTVITELIVSTWKISSDGGTSKETKFQLALAITASTSYILMIYDDDNTVGDGSDLKYFAGYINGGLGTASASYYNVICNTVNNATTGHGPESETLAAEMTYIQSNSNCRCGTDGTYVFTITDNSLTTYAGTVCKDQNVATAGTSPNNACDVAYDDGETYQRNCRVPVRTEDTCRVSAFCIVSMTDSDDAQLTMYFDDPAFTKLSFVSYSGAMSDMVTLKAPACRNVNITLNTVTLDINLGSGETNPCITLSGTDIQWAVQITEAANKIVDGNDVIYGVCSLPDLPRTISVPFSIGDIASTMIPRRDDRVISFELIDTYGYTSGTQVLDGNAVSVRLGRQVFIIMCLDYGTYYNENADAWGLSMNNVYISNNAGIEDDADNDKYRTNVVDSDGCKTTPANALTDFSVAENPKIVADALLKPSYEFCQVIGNFEARRWPGVTNIWVSAEATFCHNFGLKGSTICDDSCSNTFVNNGDRRRRETRPLGDDEETLSMKASFRIASGYEASEINCVDRTMAMPTIVALIALLVLAVVAAILLFVKLQMRKKK